MDRAVTTIVIVNWFDDDCLLATRKIHLTSFHRGLRCCGDMVLPLVG